MIARARKNILVYMDREDIGVESTPAGLVKTLTEKGHKVLVTAEVNPRPAVYFDACVIGFKNPCNRFLRRVRRYDMPNLVVSQDTDPSEFYAQLVTN